MKKLFVGWLLVAFLLPVVPVRASEQQDDLRLQLAAIMEYLSALSPSMTLTEAEIREVINNGASWIVRAQAADGHFNYEYSPYDDTYSDSDNMVRQAGTLFMLSEIYKHRSTPDTTEARAIERSIAYFESLSGQSRTSDDDFLCIKNGAKNSRCALGTTALTLIGVINYVTAEPSKQADYQELIDSYSAYLQAAKFPSRGFSSEYSLYNGFIDAESSFFTGEAMLALVRLYQLDPQPWIKTMLHDTFTYLEKQERDNNLYLWIMAALKDMQQLWPNEAYVTYTESFTSARLIDMSTRHASTHNYCALMEGVTSAYSILAGNIDGVKQSYLLSEINFWQQKTTRLQLEQDNPYRLVIIDSVPQLLKAPRPKLGHGGFLTGESELTQRIDFTQHCVSSYLQKLVDVDGQSL